MSVFSLDAAKGNPVTSETVDKLCTQLGVRLEDHEKEDYRRLLAVFHDASEQLMAMEDYIPQVDETRFPRKNIYFPVRAENTHGAWAWKCSIKDEQADNTGLLAGKKFALKDMISVKGVPMLMGTDFVKGYVPVRCAMRLPNAPAKCTCKS